MACMVMRATGPSEQDEVVMVDLRGPEVNATFGLAVVPLLRDIEDGEGQRSAKMAQRRAARGS